MLKYSVASVKPSCAQKTAVRTAGTRGKEVKKLGNLAETIIEEMQCETVFSIGPLDFSEGVVVSWVVIAVLVILSACLTRNLKVDHISKRQAAVEYVVLWLENLVEGMVGEKGRRYVPYLVTILLYISLANIFGIFGFKPPPPRS